MDQTEEKEPGSISKTLLTGISIFAAVIFLGMVLMPKPEKHYKISEEQMLAKIMSYEDVFGPEKMVDLIYYPNNKFQFIDLRSAPEFLKGHLPNAINIPINHILDKQYDKIWNQDDKTNILYYSDHAEACGPWMILTQLGFKNIKIMLGGYEYVNENIIKKYSPLTGNFKDEKANFDFAKVINQTSGNKVNTSAKENQKAGNAPVVKKKKEGKSSGGC